MMNQLEVKLGVNQFDVKEMPIKFVIINSLVQTRIYNIKQ